MEFYFELHDLFISRVHVLLMHPSFILQIIFQLLQSFAALLLIGLELGEFITIFLILLNSVF